jgi:putative transposase
MAATRKTYKPEQIVNLLREIDVLTANGQSVPQACKATGISDKSDYRWRKQYGGLKVDQARKFKELEAQNARLKRLVADLSLDKAMLKEVAAGNF